MFPVKTCGEEEVMRNIYVGQISKSFKTVETVDHFEAHYARSTV
jgi:hypothetical protein